MTSPLVGPPRPAAGAPRDYQFPRFTRTTLPNGLGLIVAPVHKLPVATAMLVLRGGAAADPPHQAGLAHLTANALSEGTTTRDADAVVVALERLGSSIEATVDWDATVIRVTTISDRLAPALRILGEVVREPSFPEHEIERLRDERLAELLQLRAEPRGLADEMFARFVYGGRGRYALPDGGTPESVRTLDRSAVLQCHAERYQPANATLVIVGDVSLEVGTRLAQEVFGGWTGQGRVAELPAQVAPQLTRAVHLVAKDDAPQSEIRIGHATVSRQHPDYFPITVMNAVLGGLFNSRVNLNLRERHAYTYGAFSTFNWRRGPGPFDVSTAVRSDVTEPAVREVLTEIDRIRAERVEADELSLATSYLGGVFPIRYETTVAMATALAALVVHDLPADYFDTYRGNIRAVSRDDVLRVATTHLHPDALQVVVVGDPAATRAALEQARFGPLTTYDSEGNALG